MKEVMILPFIIFIGLVVYLGICNIYYLWIIGSLLKESGFTSTELPRYIGDFLHNGIYLIICSIFVQSFAASVKK